MSYLSLLLVRVLAASIRPHTTLEPGLGRIGVSGDSKQAQSLTQFFLYRFLKGKRLPSRGWGHHLHGYA